MKLNKYTNGGFENNEPKYIIDDLEFIGTCGACPEQYDVVKNIAGDRYQVGYVRLRHSKLRCDFPDVGGGTIFQHAFESDDWKGCFDDEEERIYFLTLIAEVINNKLKEYQ